MPSNDLRKCEYLTGKDLGCKSSVLEKTKFEYSPLGVALLNNTKSKTNKNKLYNSNKQDRYLVYNSQHSFAKFKDINDFKELSLDSMYERLHDFQKRFNKLKIVNLKTDNNKVLKEKVLDGAGDVFNKQK